MQQVKNDSGKMGKFDPDEYRHESNAVSLLNYHFVFIPKRRKKVLVGAVAEKLQEIICGVCNENRWRIVALEIMPDHCHLFLEFIFIRLLMLHEAHHELC